MLKREANQSNSTEPETGKAQALLSKVAPQGKITNGADAYLFDMRGPALMKSLITSVAELERERDALATTLRQLMNWGVEFDDERLSYISVQVDRDAIKDAQRALGETE